MINGFEEFTHDLTAYELKLVPMFVTGFSKRVGSKNAIKTSEVVEKMKAAGYKCSPARVRKIVNYIRRMGLVQRLAATSKGYYIEPNDSNWKTFIESMYDRGNAIVAVADALSKQ